MNNPNNPLKVTPAKRVRQFGRDVLMVRNNKLFCKTCNRELDFSRKSTINSHLKSASHKELAHKGILFFHNC